MRQKRFADWFEKMSAAFMVGPFLRKKARLWLSALVFSVSTSP
jgi:hypothetical protein